ncbi:MAG: iron-containing alcohol dehydrogenase, partial [Clostridia bacterium]
MNPIKKVYYRTFQAVLKVSSAFMPWRSPKLITGEGSTAKLPAFIKEKGITSVLIVTDAQLMKLGLLDELIKGLQTESIGCIVYDKTVPNPTIENVEEGVALYKDNGCGAIIAFGGGSPMDCAKGIGARIARPKRSVEKMRGLFKILKRLPTLFAVPTTAGTGSETTVAAIITNSATHEKYVITDLSL